MKFITKLASAAIVLSAAVFSFSSCSKEEDEGKLPVIAFKTTAGYVSHDTTVGMGDTVLLGIAASKAEANDPLTKLTVTRLYDGTGAEAIVDTMTLSGATGDAVSHDYTAITRNVAGTEKYTFTVINKDGLINSVSLTLTVQ